VVVVDERLGPSFAEVDVALAKRTTALRPRATNVPRPSEWKMRRVTQRMYNALTSVLWI
jgi:hypothetical protein